MGGGGQSGPLPTLGSPGDGRTGTDRDGADGGGVGGAGEAQVVLGDVLAGPQDLQFVPVEALRGAGGVGPPQREDEGLRPQLFGVPGLETSRPSLLLEFLLRVLVVHRRALAVALGGTLVVPGGGGVSGQKQAFLSGTKSGDPDPDPGLCPALGSPKLVPVTPPRQVPFPPLHPHAATFHVPPPAAGFGGSPAGARPALGAGEGTVRIRVGIAAGRAEQGAGGTPKQTLQHPPTPAQPPGTSWDRGEGVPGGGRVWGCQGGLFCPPPASEMPSG